MRINYPLYYGESIPKKKHSRICQKIQEGRFSKKDRWFIIVLYHDKETFFEKISIKEFELNRANNYDFDVLGIVQTNQEFKEFTLHIMELLIGKTKVITKENLINLYRETNHEDIKI